MPGLPFKCYRKSWLFLCAHNTRAEFKFEIRSYLEKTVLKIKTYPFRLHGAGVQKKEVPTTEVFFFSGSGGEIELRPSLGKNTSRMSLASLLSESGKVRSVNLLSLSLSLPYLGEEGDNNKGGSLSLSLSRAKRGERESRERIRHMKVESHGGNWMLANKCRADLSPPARYQG